MVSAIIFGRIGSEAAICAHNPPRLPFPTAVADRAVPDIAPHRIGVLTIATKYEFGQRTASRPTGTNVSNQAYAAYVGCCGNASAFSPESRSPLPRPHSCVLSSATRVWSHQGFDEFADIGWVKYLLNGSTTVRSSKKLRPTRSGYVNRDLSTRLTTVRLHCKPKQISSVTSGRS
jgi:hypothetical protein